jgi:hypothetical protein
MSHQEFATSTPREINERIDGYEWRLNRQMEREARWVCALINATGRLKNSVRPERLLGRPIGPQYDLSARGDRTGKTKS